MCDVRVCTTILFQLVLRVTRTYCARVRGEGYRVSPVRAHDARKVAKHDTGMRLRGCFSRTHSAHTDGGAIVSVALQSPCGSLPHFTTAVSPPVAPPLATASDASASRWERRSYAASADSRRPSLAQVHTPRCQHCSNSSTEDRHCGRLRSSAIHSRSHHLKLHQMEKTIDPMSQCGSVVATGSRVHRLLHIWTSFVCSSIATRTGARLCANLVQRSGRLKLTRQLPGHRLRSCAWRKCRHEQSQLQLLRSSSIEVAATDSVDAGDSRMIARLGGVAPSLGRLQNSRVCHVLRCNPKQMVCLRSHPVPANNEHGVRLARVEHGPPGRSCANASSPNFH